MNRFTRREWIRHCVIFGSHLMAVLVLCFTLPGVLYAVQIQDQGPRVEGVVVDSLHAPVANALVWFSRPHYVSPKELTGIDGEFAFDLKTFEPVHLIVEAKGFSRVELLVTPIAGQT